MTTEPATATAPPTAPHWPLLDRPVWRRSFPLKLSVAIPVIVTALVILTGLFEAFFISRIFRGAPLPTAAYQQLVPLLRAAQFVFIVCIGVAAVIAILLSHAITQPIQRLVQHARTLATGNLAARLAGRSSDEFSVLETAFNDMAIALKAYQTQMEEYNQTLEERVVARTTELATVLNMSKNMLYILDRARLLRLLASGLHDVTRYDVCAIALRLEADVDVFVWSVGPLHPPLGKEFVGRVQREMAYLAGVTPPSDEHVHVTVNEETDWVVGARSPSETLKSFILAPLMVGTTVTGAVALGSLQRQSFDEHIARMLTIIANHAALALDNTKAYARLQELDRLKSDFVSTVSHELRTPVNVIQEGVALLHDTRPEGLTDQQRELLTSVQLNTEQLARLVNDLLDVSKLEAGAMRFDRRATDLADVITTTLRRLASSAEQRGLQLAAELPEGLPPVYADPDKISQVLTNLTGNALKYTPTGGTIYVNARTVGELIETRVWNSGEPLPAHERERIFDKFYQVGRAQGPGTRGTGLGLSIVRRIIQQHGGGVWAQSDPQGNSFFFTLPRFNRLTYLTDTLSTLLEEARVNGSFCALVRLAWQDADQWRSRVGEQEWERLLRVWEQTVRQAVERQGLADRTLRFGEMPALALLATTNPEGAAALADTALEALRIHPLTTADGQVLPASFGIRIALYPNDGQTPEALLRAVSA